MESSLTGNYSVGRRIWRIVYPPLLFIAISVFVMATSIVVVFVSASLSEITGEMAVLDWDTITNEVLLALSKYAMHIQLITGIVSLAVFIPVWIKTSKSNTKYINEDPAAISMKVIGLFAALNILQVVLFTVTDIMQYFPSYEDIIDLLMTDSIVLQILAVGVVAPVIEELVFRGILLSRMNWLPAWLSVLIQGILFGLVHLNLFQGLYAFVAGILLGLVYLKFRSIIIVIIGHMAYNLASILLAEFASEDVAGVVLISSIIVLPACAYMIIKHDKAQPLESDVWALDSEL